MNYDYSDMRAGIQALARYVARQSLSVSFEVKTHTHAENPTQLDYAVKRFGVCANFNQKKIIIYCFGKKRTHIIIIIKSEVC